jgi:hypothetical protein
LIPARTRDFFFSITPRTALGRTHLSVKFVPGLFFRGKVLRSRMTELHLHSLTRLHDVMLNYLAPGLFSVLSLFLNIEEDRKPLKCDFRKSEILSVYY